MGITKEDHERARLVDQDLRHLLDEWVPRFDEAELRRLSATFRRLLVENDYVRAWKAIGLPGQPYISATDLAAALGDATREYIQYAFAPPAIEVATLLREHAKGQMALGVISDAPVGAQAVITPGYFQALPPMLIVVPPDVLEKEDGTDGVAERHLRLGPRVVRGSTISRFMASPAALVQGVEISRQDVIQYVANKLGGAHFDMRRQQEDRLNLLDQKLARIKLDDGSELSASHVELLSIGQFLAESSDAARFRDTFAKVDPPEEAA